MANLNSTNLDWPWSTNSHGKKTRFRALLVKLLRQALSFIPLVYVGNDLFVDKLSAEVTESLVRVIVVWTGPSLGQVSYNERSHLLDTRWDHQKVPTRQKLCQGEAKVDEKQGAQICSSCPWAWAPTCQPQAFCGTFARPGRHDVD